MWASAQRDGNPVECRWRPVFNTANFGWRPLLECCAGMLPRCETRWNMLGCPKLANRSQPLLGQSSPYFEDTWGRHYCLTSFFPIVNTCLSCEGIAQQRYVMVHRWRIFGDFLGPAFPASRVQHISDMHSKCTLRPHHVWKYDRHTVCDGRDRRGKKERRKKKPQDEIMVCPIP